MGEADQDLVPADAFNSTLEVLLELFKLRRNA